MVLACAGCNQVWGLESTRLRDASEIVGGGEAFLDIDVDGVSDAVDPCIAPMRDGLDDLDGDGVAASTDRCPFDASAVVDGDGDGVPDTCDPFPATGGDRLRCYMSFGSTDLNAVLWKPRDATDDWASREGELYTKQVGPTSGLVGTRDLEATPQMTYEAFVSLDNGAPAQGDILAFRVWARAADAYNNQEVGCEISGDAASTRLAVVRGNDMDVPGGATTLVGIGFPRSVPVRIRVTFAPGGTGLDVRCTFAWSTFAPSVKARIAELPLGHLAFGTQELQAHVSALAIYERDTVVPLP